MKYLLIAIYIAHGGTQPETRSKTYLDKAQCHEMASRYVKDKNMGQARAFCVQLKGVQ